VDRAGKTIDILSEPDSYTSFRLSPDGKRFVATRGEGGPANSLWVMAMDRRVFSLFTPKSPLAVNQAAVWSNDGQTVLFNQGGVVFRKNISASGEGERIADWGLRRVCDWSRDGRYLLYESYDAETKRDLWVAQVTPDGKPVEGIEPKPYLRGTFSEWHGRFSPEPNPRWVVYQSDETGRNEVYIASFPDARRRLQVTSGGGTFPQWGSDGRELFYLSGDGMMTAVGLRNGPEGLELSSPQSLFPMAARSYIASPFEVAPDGKRILVNQAEQNMELDVVVNWPLLLRNQAGQ
jgi:Tol biopolymer transport system component